MSRFFLDTMLPLGILHSVIQTLILALSASGRSASGLEQFADKEFHFAVALPSAWTLGTRPIVYPAVRLESVPPSLPKSTTPSIAISAGELLQSSLEYSFLASTRAHKRIWGIEPAPNSDFLGAPAKNILLKLPLGAISAKIRKTFRVHSHINISSLLARSSTAPPDDYDRN